MRPTPCPAPPPPGPTPPWPDQPWSPEEGRMGWLLSGPPPPTLWASGLSLALCGPSSLSSGDDGLEKNHLYKRVNAQLQAGCGGWAESVFSKAPGARSPVT